MIERILVPVDGDAGSERAIAAGLALARQTGAVLAAFVAEPLPPRALRPLAPRAREQAECEHTSMTQAHARGVLAQCEALARDAGVQFEGHHATLATTDPAVVAAALALRCDLVVLALQGRGAFGEFLFGSQTKALLAGSGMPLFIIPEAAASGPEGAQPLNH
jgi:nucleotide-binding universal stress UspA family protein